jgi:hypothetical protein
MFPGRAGVGRRRHPDRPAAAASDPFERDRHAMPLRTAPVLARVLPFAMYIAFLIAESAVGDRLDGRWLYAAQVAVVAGLLVWFLPAYRELRRPTGTRLRDWLLAWTSSGRGSGSDRAAGWRANSPTAGRLPGSCSACSVRSSSCR